MIKMQMCVYFRMIIIIEMKKVLGTYILFF